ncbi:MAG TPA: FAD-dependent oxidoreductase [Thermoanaerobaculia bacterium]|nr:FAD-dependent oxidoreductase [Thermoanaerobaculia bacterium]
MDDYLVIGAGVIGLSIARELRRRDARAKITVLDRESTLAAHASGRNSGVLHAGFYYSPDSLKARFTRVGNERLTEYCVERKLPIRRCGKLVVARNADELPRLDELHRRGIANGVRLSMISAKEAHDLEPRAKVFERAIWSPTTSTVDPRAVMEALLRDAKNERIDVRFNTPWSRTMQAGKTINAAGLGAVTIARAFGFAPHYRMLPFRGVYLYSSEPRESLRTHIYPVPDPRFPFLGVHFTLTVDGTIKIGPTARPSLLHGALLLLTQPDLRAHAIEELRKSSRRHIVGLAATLAENVKVRDYTKWGLPGIRAQLYDTRRHALEMDFVLEHDERSMHVLNVVSPGFTCALPFAEHVVDTLLAD